MSGAGNVPPDGTAYDAIIVGGGHNGLTCAAFLARAGRRVAVFEAAPIAGGFCTTEATVPEAPGFLMNPYAADLTLVGIPRSIEDDLDLGRYGLRWVFPDPIFTYLSRDGSSFVVWRDRERTKREIARLSRRDAERYDQFVQVMRDFWHTVIPYLQGHPRRVEPGMVLDIVRRAAHTRRSLGAAARILLSSPAAVLDEWFEREELKAALAQFALNGLCPLDESGCGALLSAVALYHEYGVRRPVGGSGVFTQALTACLEAHGGELCVDAPVRRIEVSNGRAVAVELQSGQRYPAAHVIAAVDPVTLFDKLVDPAVIPAAVGDELRGLQSLKNNISIFKGDVALSRRPCYPAFDRSDAEMSSLILAPDLACVRRFTQAAMSGELSDDPPMMVITPTVFDRSLVPPANEGDSLYVYLPGVPYQLADSTSWEAEKAKYLERCLDIVEDYAAGHQGLRDRCPRPKPRRPGFTRP